MFAVLWSIGKEKTKTKKLFRSSDWEFVASEMHTKSISSSDSSFAIGANAVH